MKFAYADPPYFKQGKKLYGKLHDQAHVWDSKQAHWELIDRLLVDYPDGWALSCNPADLPWIIRHDNIRICVWAKTFHQIRPTTVQYAWEAVLLGGGGKTTNANLWFVTGLRAQELCARALLGPSRLPSIYGYLTYLIINRETP